MRSAAPYAPRAVRGTDRWRAGLASRRKAWLRARRGPPGGVAAPPESGQPPAQPGKPSTICRRKTPESAPGDSRKKEHIAWPEAESGVVTGSRKTAGDAAARTASMIRPPRQGKGIAEAEVLSEGLWFKDQCLAQQRPEAKAGLGRLAG